MVINKTFQATIIKETNKGGWTYVIWPEYATFFGTGKPIKVIANIEGYDFQATFLPVGDGTHMLPLRAATMKAINKQPGDTIKVLLKEQL